MLYERVLVTGANGLLGRELVGLLSRFSEYDVLATGRSGNDAVRGLVRIHAPGHYGTARRTARLPGFRAHRSDKLCGNDQCRSL